MSETPLDQAAGLRKLLKRSPFRSITVAGAEARENAAAVAGNLAAALAHQGRTVLFADCAGDLSSPGPQGAADRRDSESGCTVVRDSRVTSLAAADPQGLASALDRHPGNAEMLLVCGPPGDLACAAASREILLVVTPSPAAVTSGYRLLKRLQARWGQRRVLILVEQASIPAQADQIFGNLSGTCRRFLNLPVEYLGWIPDDERIRRAARLRQTVMEAFPQSEAALALSACAERLCRSPFPGDGGVADFAHRLIELTGTTVASA
jgi:flagellar biosynthesis protein FlhG